VVSGHGDVIYTTETDSKTGRGRIGVRDARSLKKLAEWDSHGLEPHQLLLDDTGHLMIANGGIPRTPNDKSTICTAWSHRWSGSTARAAACYANGRWRIGASACAIWPGAKDDGKQTIPRRCLAGRT
jgi:hypothetical protein